ncbi:MULTISPECIES: ATP-binding cassette domain-containing protein [unclassified Salinibacterium]|uniref:ATP-binding cassette domain-containing protein n=1 Tax=unclassified Salinibacterium TaxID=2632331 RepID=UPI00142486EE|nr:MULTISPECIES: ATP-binding cassette domain-containing protein [unclassified Salinibacterium]
MAVAASDLSMQYPGERMLAVNGVSFGVRRGEILAVVGEAGAGKSTLLRALAGQVKAGEAGLPEIVGGDLTVLGVPMRSLRRRKREWLAMAVGFLPQDAGSGLTPHLTVGENVAEPIYSRDQKFDRLEAGTAVATLIDAVRLPLGVMGKFPHELSRGQRQRVALAKALILEPELLVADDPTMGVDVMVRGPIFDVIRDLQQDREFSAVVVGHDVRELRRMTDKVAVMQGGVIVGFGGIEQVLRNPHHPYVESLARTLGYK